MCKCTLPGDFLCPDAKQMNMGFMRKKIYNGETI